MATCVVSGTLLDPSTAVLSSVVVKFNIVTPTLDAGSNLIMPKEVSTTTDVSGVFSMTLDQGISGILTIQYPPNDVDGTVRKAFSIVIPSAPTATLASLLTEL